MTISNDGNIPARLLLDLREKIDEDGIECLDASLVKVDNHCYYPNFLLYLFF
jgi:hypothetical protein